MYNNQYDPYNTPNSQATPQNSQEYTYIHGIGFSPLLGVMREKKALRRCANAIGISMLAYLALSYLIPDIISLASVMLLPLYGLSSSQAYYQLIGILSTVIAMGLPFFIYAVSIRIPVRRALPLQMPPLSLLIPSIFLTFGATAVASFASGILQNLLYFLGIYAPGNLGELPTTTASATVVYLISSTLLPAVLEEFVFRGVLMQSLRRFGDAMAVVVSAVLFAAAHGNIIVFPLALTMGLCSGYFVIRMGSLWPSILFHFLYNSLSIGLNEAYMRLPQNISLLLSSALTLAQLLLAVLSLIYLMKTRTGIFSLKPAQTTLNESAKLKTFFSSVAIIVVLCLFALLAITNLYAY